MNRILPVALFLALLFSCTSSRTYMARGDYDRALSKAVKKLSKNRNKVKQILVLEESYNKANELDNDRLRFLKLEGNPGNWDEVYGIYIRLKGRQQKVRRVLPLKIEETGRVVDFPVVNYDQEILNAKQKAAEFFYTRGKLTLEKGGRYNARAAFADFEQVRYFYPDFRDVNELMNKARQFGISNVIFRMENKSGAILPPGFKNDLERINLYGMNSKWVNFHSTPTEGLDYPYTILLNIRGIDVSPERVQENAYMEQKEIQDGFTYVLDNKGNVMKDSLGNDIKVPKYKTITCQVIETHLSKAAIITGTLDFINNETGQVMRTEPVTAENFFNHHFATARGDIKALKPETLKKLDSGPAPFPPDFDMLMACGEVLKNMSKTMISNNHRMFE